MGAGEKITLQTTQFLFAIIIFCCLAFVISRFDSEQGFTFNLDSNIKDLSPKLTQNEKLSVAVDHIAAAIESRFTLLLLGKDNEIALAANQIATGLSKFEGVNASVNNGTLPVDLLHILGSYRFNFLTPEQRVQLDKEPQAKLIDQAIARLYQLGSTQGLLPLEKDPLGWFTDYIVRKNTALNLSRNSADAKLNHLAVNVSLTQSGMNVNTQEQLTQTINGLEKKVNKLFPNIKILHSGILFIAAETTKQAKADIGRISIVSIIAVMGLLFLTFNSLKPLLLSFASIFVGIIFALVVTHFIYGSIHVFTIVFGASLIGVVVDYSLHYFCHQSLNAQRPSKHLLSAMQLSLISSVIGYAALALSDLISLQKVAVFSCAGLVAAWVSVIALSAKIKLSSRKQGPKFLPLLVEILSNFTLWLIRFNKIFLTIVFLIAAGLVVTGVKGNDHPGGYFKLSTELLAQETEVAGYTQSVEPGRYFVVRGKDVETLYQNLELLYSKIPDAPLLSILDWLPSPHHQRENHQLQSKLYAPLGVIEQFMRALKMEQAMIINLMKEYQALSQRVLLPDQLFNQHRAWLPPLIFEYNELLYSFVLISKNMQLTTFDFESIDIASVDFFDTAGISKRELKNQRQSALQLLMVAFLLIACLLLLKYRKFSALWMLIVPVSAIIVTVFLLSILGVGLTLFHTMALFLVLGLGMDYVIFVSELNHHRSITLQAIVLSAITSLLSFGLLSVSNIPAVSAFGSVILIGICVNLLGAMLYMHSKHLT